MRPASITPPSALLQSFSVPRSLAIASALVLHFGLAAMLAMPIAAPEVETHEPTVIRTDVLPPPPPPPIAPPPPERAVRSVAATRPASASRPAPTRPPDAVAVPTTETPAPIDTFAPEAPVDSLGSDTGPAEESLLLRRGTPPRYPSPALSRRLEGEVELLILVGIDGRPETVTITRSSGHAVLDRAAREHVLRRWVFEPLLRDGIPVPAYARVPVRFTLP